MATMTLYSGPFDSTQIFEYFQHFDPQPPLSPELPAARAHARLLELKSDEMFFPHVIRLMSLQDRLGEPPAQEAIFHLHRLYAEWESTLGSKDCLSESYSYADIAFFMAQFFAATLGAPMIRGTPGLLAWRTRARRSPGCGAVCGNAAVS
jgi:glutathione S-transferase